MKCRVCSSQTTPTHGGIILKKYNVQYHLCPSCDYWCTDEAFWLDEAYSEAVSSMDTGVVARNLSIHRSLAPALVTLFGTGPYVDWAGGAGLLVRLMRDTGLDFYWQDAYAENVLAKGWSGTGVAMAGTPWPSPRWRFWSTAPTRFPSLSRCSLAPPLTL